MSNQDTSLNASQFTELILRCSQYISSFIPYQQYCQNHFLQIYYIYQITVPLNTHKALQIDIFVFIRMEHISCLSCKCMIISTLPQKINHRMEQMGIGTHQHSLQPNITTLAITLLVSNASREGMCIDNCVNILRLLLFFWSKSEHNQHCLAAFGYIGLVWVERILRESIMEIDLQKQQQLEMSAVFGHIGLGWLKTSIDRLHQLI